MEASYVDLADPRHLEFDYLRWARIVLDAVRARRVLHIGGAGCALARALAAADPASRHEVVEVDERVLGMARAHLGLRVRLAEGRAARRRAPTRARTRSWSMPSWVPACPSASSPSRPSRTPRASPRWRSSNVVDTRTLHDTRAIAAGLCEAYPHVAAVGSRALRGGNVVLARPVPSIVGFPTVSVGYPTIDASARRAPVRPR